MVEEKEKVCFFCRTMPYTFVINQDKFVHLSSASPRGGGEDPGLMLGNTGTLWGLCNKISALVVEEMWGLRFLNALLSGRMWELRFCLTERRLGTIDCLLNRWGDGRGEEE